MVKFRRAFLLLAAVGSLFLITSGCQQAEKMNITHRVKIMLKLGESFKSENNPFLQEVEKLTGITLEIDTPSSSSYNERLNVVMASGDMPQIVQLNWFGEGNFPAWAKSGLLRPIELEKTQNIEVNVPRSILTMMKVGNDDRVYGVPGVTTSNPYGVIIRQDWLQKLGLDQPRTLEEFINVLRAFVYMDPDRNGKADTHGITSYRLNHFGGVFGSAFKIDYLWNSIHLDASDRGSGVKPREEQSAYLEFMDFTKDCYSEQLLDRSFTNIQNAEDKFILGKTGMIGAYSNDTIKLEKELQKFVPEARLEWLLCPGDSEGRVWNFIPESYGYNGVGSMIGNGAVFLITKSSQDDTALKFLDAMNTQEMILLSNLGIKGTHYEEYDGIRKLLKRTENQNEAVKRDLFGISDTFRGQLHAYLGDNPEENDRLDYYEKKGRLLITNPPSFNMGFEPGIATFQQINPLFRERERVMAIKYITGEISRVNYANYLKNENLPQKKQLSRDLDKSYKQLVEAVK